MTVYINDFGVATTKLGFVYMEPSVNINVTNGRTVPSISLFADKQLRIKSYTSKDNRDAALKFIEETLAAAYVPCALVPGTGVYINGFNILSVVKRTELNRTFSITIEFTQGIEKILYFPTEKEREEAYKAILKIAEDAGESGDYNALDNLPTLNGNKIQGDLTSEDLGIPTKTSELENDANFVSYQVEDGTGRKFIVLMNHDGLQGEMTDGTQVNLAMVSKWDVADFGSKALHYNINTSDYVTVNDSDIVVVLKDYGNGRRTIELKNYDSISGLDTEGTNYNLVMLSKWNIADFGSTGIHMNLNTKDFVTINDKQVVAAYKLFDNNRLTLELRNHDTISGLDSTGTGHNIAMISKWDVADFGAAGLHTNLNTKDVVTINDKDVVATDKDLELKANKTELEAAVEDTDKKLALKADKATTYTKTEVDEIIAKIDQFKVKVVDELPEVGEELTVYLVPKDSSLQEEDNIYNEYIYSDGRWGHIGDTKIDLSDYVTNAKLATELEKKQDNLIPSENLLVNGANIDVNAQKVVLYSLWDNRKFIQLANHDALSGITTEGEGVNLAMVSKWDVADFGSNKVHMNLNTKDVVTINDKDVVATDKDLALKADKSDVEQTVQEINDSIELKADKENTYTKTEIDDIISKINQFRVELVESLPETGESLIIYLVPKDPTKVEQDNLYNEFLWVQDKWEKIGDTKIDLSDYVTNSKLSEELSKKQNNLSVSENLTLNNDSLDVNVQKVVLYSLYDNRKFIQLANHDALSGVTTTGEGVNLAMVSKWDVADFGSNKLPLNLNSSTRPKVNDKEEIAYLSDLSSIEIPSEQVKYNNEDITTVKEALDKLMAGMYKSFVYEQALASNRWEVNHKLGRFPSVTVVDSAGTTVEGDIQYTDNNNVVIEFSAPFTGKAYLS